MHVSALCVFTQRGIYRYKKHSFNFFGPTDIIKSEIKTLPKKKKRSLKSKPIAMTDGRILIKTEQQTRPFRYVGPTFVKMRFTLATPSIIDHQNWLFQFVGSIFVRPRLTLVHVSLNRPFFRSLKTIDAKCWSVLFCTYSWAEKSKLLKSPVFMSLDSSCSVYLCL